jgi:hypothetical protein
VVVELLGDPVGILGDLAVILGAGVGLPTASAPITAPMQAANTTVAASMACRLWRSFNLKAKREAPGASFAGTMASPGAIGSIAGSGVAGVSLPGEIDGDSTDGNSLVSPFALAAGGSADALSSPELFSMSLAMDRSSHWRFTSR